MANTGERVYEVIRQRILDQVYVPSQTLVESALAEELGVSRNTIKTALMKLVNEKLVEIKTNKSAIVKSLNIDEAVHLLEIRERLEGLIAYDAASKISHEDLDKISGYLEEMRDYLNQNMLKDYSATNDKIHHLIYNACSNTEAIDIIKSIRVQLRRYNKRTILISGRSDESITEHEAIYKALRLRNPEEAEKSMRRHIANVRNVLKDNYHVLF
ncbi:MAG: hypothetical protein K0S75_1967 [Clostridia bacterium]|jgi:DNA-binding GntR family transcriptional regulator|nr:hypothetical protein [Clostridia bacterium]